MDIGSWIKLHNAIRQHWIWQKPEYLKWWLDLLMMAAYKNKKVLMNEKLVELHRGEFSTSIEALGQRWGVGKKAVNGFLDLLVADEMIDVQKMQRYGTIVKVRNYGLYQDNLQGKGTNDGNNDGNNEAPNAAPIEATNAGTNDGNNEMPTKPENSHHPPPPTEVIEVTEVQKYRKKKKTTPTPPVAKTTYAEFVSMTNDEYSTLVTKLGEDGALRCIELLDNYKGSSGRAYKSDYRAILNWVIKRYEEEQAKQPRGGNNRNSPGKNYEGDIFGD